MYGTKFVEKVQDSIMIAVGLKQEFKSCNDHHDLNPKKPQNWGKKI